VGVGESENLNVYFFEVVAICDHLCIVIMGKTLVPIEKIDHAIIFLGNKRVMLDADLAMIFGTTTQRLNEKD
jgi:hypothetical protein